MNPPAEWRLDTRRLGRRVLVYDRLDSTNNRAAELAGDLNNDGLVVLADTQTAGRGQHGRSWLCTPGAGVLLSALLFPPLALRRPALLTAWAAVSVCETIRTCTGLDAAIKWPNDVFLGGRKVCGILIEQGRGTVAGIGLNVKQPPETFASAGLTEAVSLEMAAGQPLDRDDVARRLIRHLDEEYDRLCHSDFASLEDRWRSHLGLLGAAVVAECHDGSRSGRLTALTLGELILVRSGVGMLRLKTEQVRHLRLQE